jgi:hypothetical protein
MCSHFRVDVIVARVIIQVFLPIADFAEGDILAGEGLKVHPTLTTLHHPSDFTMRDREFTV